MKVLRHLKHPILSHVIGSLLVSNLLLGAWPVAAQVNFRLNLPDLRAPGNRESGSTRSNTCVNPEDNLTALIPQSNYGLTQSGYPTLYAYLPENTAELARFIIYSQATDELVYEGQFNIEGESGIVGITLPNNGIQRPLEVGQSYIWYFTLICDPAAIDQSGNAVVEGTIARVITPSAANGAAAEALPAAFAEAGLWYDALSASAKLKQRDDAAWNFLLEAVDLGPLIPVPVLSEGSQNSTATTSAQQ